MNNDLAADRLSALGNPTRLSIFRLLVRAGNDGITIGDIQNRLKVPASTLAHHLQALEQAGLVSQERRGRTVINTANFGTMNALIAYLSDECCTGV